MKRVGLLAAGVAVIGLGLSGCRAGPTYGTGKTSGEQFVEDMSNIVAFKPSTSNMDLDTKPRPELVRPAAGELSTLPPPQENITRARSADWPESPEERRKRLRDEATANRDNRNYVSPIVQDGGKADKRYLSNGIDRARERENFTADPVTTKKQREEYRRRKQSAAGGTATSRQYLSEPPLEYRKPADTAPAGDLGDTEDKKQRAAKKKSKS